MKLFFTTFTIILLNALLFQYLKMYQSLPNQFTLGLILFSVSLLLYAITSNPVVPLVFEFRRAVDIGPFTFLPDLFSSLAVVSLVLQSNT